jgi:RNA polymerase sigma factor (sigma-70 family)
MGSEASEGLTDSDLVAQLSTGSQEALAELYDRHGRLAYGVALRVLGDPGRAEDAVQEVFLKIWNRAASFDFRSGSLGTWLLTSVHNQSIDYLRGASERQEPEIEPQPALVEVGALPLDVEEVTPPAGLRERILTAAKAPRESATATVKPIYAAVAAVLLALLVGVVAGDLIGRGAPLSGPVARSSLVGHHGYTGAKATVIDLKSDGVAVVEFSGLPQLDPGRVYEVWLITAGGRADPAGVFVPDSNGSKVVLVGQSLAGYTEMAITSEVGPNGTLAPTQQPQLYGTLA